MIKKSFPGELSFRKFLNNLFSEEQSDLTDEITKEDNHQENNDSNQLFDQDINEEEDFEIPAFLRKQKF